MQKSHKCKPIKPSQENPSRSETLEPCNSRTCENQSPGKITSHVKALLKSGSGKHRCEICGDITGYTIAKIEQDRVLNDCTECISKHLHVLCDVCLARILSQSSAKSVAPKKYTGRVTPCSSNTCEFFSRIKEDESNSCHASCNTKTDRRPSSKCSNLKAEKLYEMCYAKCSRKSETPSKRTTCEVAIKKHRMPCGADGKNNTKSEDKRETTISKPKGNAKSGGKSCNKKIKVDPKRSRIKDIKNTESQSVTPFNIEDFNSALKKNIEQKTSSRMVNFPEIRYTPASSSAEILQTGNFEITSNRTEYGDVMDDNCTNESEKESYKSSAKEHEVPPKVSFHTRNSSDVGQNSNSQDCHETSCCTSNTISKKGNAETPQKYNEQSLAVRETCEPCYPSVKESIASKEQHCAECADPAKIECDNCLSSCNKDNTSKVAITKKTSSTVCQNTATCCECEDNKDINPEANEDVNKGQSLMICDTCEPCYPSVKESMISKEQHCVECEDPANIECDNCLSSNFEDKTSKVTVRERISSSGCQYAATCCECEDDKDINPEASEDVNKGQSLMICETCEPCYPSVKKSIASNKQHCVECEGPANIECENCLASNFEDEASKVTVGEKVSSSRCQYAATCCECEDNKSINPEASEDVNKGQSLMICDTCEPCYPSVKESIASKEQHCAECADPAKIECDNCLSSCNKDNTSKVAITKKTSSTVCQNTATCCECEDNKDINPEANEDVNKGQSLMICDTCEPCYPSVKESMISKEQHCVECEDPANIECDNCLFSNFEYKTSKVTVGEKVSSSRCQYAATCCECEDNKSINPEASEDVNKGQSLMICDTCEPCYPSVKESMASRKQHCVECEDPANIECENCLASNFEDKTSEITIGEKVSSSGCQYAATCCECEDNKDINPEVSEHVNKGQSLMICETCEPCYPSVKESMASKEQHCVECEDPANIVCENCLASNFEDKTSKVTVGEKVSSSKCHDAATCCECEDNKDINPEANEDVNKGQSIMICETCEPCFPSVKESVASKERHCVECEDLANIECDNCLSINKLSKVGVQEKVSLSRCHDAATCCECEDNKGINGEASEDVNKRQSLMICETCEPCYPSVKESIASKEQHCVECEDPANIECENCLASSFEDKTSKVTIGEKVSSSACQHAETCCECEDKKDINPEANEDVNKGQSVMICETCEPCYPSVQESIASKEPHCVECEVPGNIECENCLASNFEDKTSKVIIGEKVSSSGCQHAETCCECEDKKNINPELSEEVNKAQSLMICETCEPCYLSVKESFASKEQHCVKCEDPGNIKCENCVASNFENKISKVTLREKVSSSGCQYATTCCECEDNKDINSEVSEDVNKGQSRMICETCEPCYPSVKESIACIKPHCDECANPTEIDCEKCLASDYEGNKVSAVSSDQLKKVSYAEDHEMRDKKQSQMICEGCEPCSLSLQKSMATMEVHCVECAEPNKIECESCLVRITESNKSFPCHSVTPQASKIPVETQMSVESSRCCECEDDKATPTVASERANEVYIICESCKNKSSRDYANVSTKISFAQSNKEIQCQNSEFESVNSRLPKEGCRSHCCECDDDPKPETKTICASCESCKRSIDEQNFGDGVHCLECSNLNEILCESCLEVSSKRDSQTLYKKSGTKFKCNECIDEKCAPTNCRSCEDKSRDSVTYCETCEPCKDSFSEISETTHCSTCADITNIECESCLEMQNKEKHRINEDQLDAKLIYELVCETCKQLSGAKECSARGSNSVKKTNKSNDSCTCKCSETDCKDCETNQKIIDEYFGLQQTSNSEKKSKEKDKNVKTSVPFVNCTEDDCPHYKQTISHSNISKGLQKDSALGCIYCGACEECQNGERGDNCSDCIDSNNILCESCLNLTNKQNRIAGTKSQSSQRSQQPNITFTTPERPFDVNSSKNNHEENCKCCICKNGSLTEQKARNLVTKHEMAMEKHSTITDEMKDTLSCSCSSCIGSEKHQIACYSRGINAKLTDEVPTKESHTASLAAQEQTTKCCLEPECVKCGQSQNENVVSSRSSVSGSASVTSTGDYSSRSFEKPEQSISRCSTQNVIDLGGASIPFEAEADSQASKSTAKCSCHVSTDTSKPTVNIGGAERCPEVEEKSSKQVANSPKGECGTALKYKLSSNDRASDYVLLDGPVYIKKSCVGGKDKVSFFATKLVFKCIFRFVNQLQVHL
nr:unnamed protein product [Callosobruchus analis]